MNDFARPEHVSPVEQREQIGPTWRHEFPAWSLTVVCVQMEPRP